MLCLLVVSCSTSSEQNFSYIMARKGYIRWDDDDVLLH